MRIPDDLWDMADETAHAFYGCENLVGIALPDGLESIGDYAFLGCENLTSVTLPDSLTFIGDYAFMYEVVLSISRDSYAEEYASQYSFSYTYKK